MRTFASTVLLAALVGVALLRCSTSSNAPAADASADALPDLCDLNAYTGVGKPCAYVSSKVCFKQCTIGGCKCVAGASGPTWTCVTDVSCEPDSGPLDDAPNDTSSAGDAPSDG